VYLICLGLFIAAIFVLHKELKDYHYQDILSHLQQIPKRYLFLAIILTLCDYSILTCYDRLALSYLKRNIPYPRVAMASFISYVFSHNMTFIGGSAVRYRLYSALSVPIYDIAKLVIFNSLTFWLGVLSLGGITFIASPPATPGAVTIPAAVLRGTGVIFLSIVAAYLALVRFHRGPLKIASWTLPLPTAAIAVMQILIAALDLFTASWILFALLPTNTLTYFSFLGIYLFAIVAGLLSYIPGGLGVFDTIILLSLKTTMSPPAIIGALVLYRMIYYLVPFGLATLLLGIYEAVSRREVLKTLSLLIGKSMTLIAPQLLTLALTIAGMILLFSGALPSVHGRMRILRDFLPLPAIEMSHFFGSLAGAAMLMLARAVQRRINAAYPIAIILLSCGILFCLTKGLDYEEAGVLFLILLIFIPCRRQFYRKAALLSQCFTPGWYVLIFAILFCSVWLGFFAFKHIEYRNQLWWQFAFHSDAPRFLRAAGGATILIGILATASLFKPSGRLTQTQASPAKETIQNIVKACPNTYAHLALLGDKHFLINSSQSAFLMYAIQGKSCVVMGDPIGPKSEWNTLLWNFRDLCDKHGHWPVFYEVDNRYLDHYIDLGMSFLKLGEEARIPLEEFALDGPQRRDLRYTHRKAQKEGISFDIIPAENVTDDIMSQMKIISDAWLSQKHGTEKGFSLGWFTPAYLKQCPVAVIRRGFEMIAFANLWDGANYYELSVDLMRFDPSGPYGLMDFLFIELMLWGKTQGYQYFNLGMAPLSGLDNHPLAPLWHKVGLFLFRHGEHFYNFQGLRKYKEKFLPNWSPKYLACPRSLIVPRVLTDLTLLIGKSKKTTS
jgi:phosphatidylglycerol lysyltransferase